MNLAKVSANGQITVPVEIRRLLSLSSGDKILFLRNGDGEVVLSNAANAIVRRGRAASSSGSLPEKAGGKTAAPAKKKKAPLKEKGRAS
ncbi:MAG: AbrB/MazE/SpoVT family DNA-binding domain-containing protein [Bacteroidales bacterium]|nr:AbrB/MazE/SpoVT family DNA-binding domain-containing protein [Bacteroidales bacterium]